MAVIIRSEVLFCLLSVLHVSVGSNFQDIVAPLKFIGGRGDGSSSVGHANGIILQRVEVWAGPSALNCVVLHWSEGESSMIGRKQEGKYSSFTFKPGERLTSLSLWGNGAGTRCGAFKMITTTKREYFPQMTSWGLKSEYPAEIGSGIIIGYISNYESEVHALGFYILRPVALAVLKNVNYPDLNLNRVGLQPWNIDVIDYSNSGSSTQTQKLIGTREITTSHTWSIGASLELCVSVSVQAGIPEVGSAGVKTTFKVGIEATYSRTTSVTNTRSYEFPVVVPPGKRTSASARLYHGPINTRYTGTMNIILDNGHSFNYPIHGTYEGVTSTGAFVDLKEYSA